MLRKLVILFWTGTLVFLALIFLVGNLMSGEEAGAAAWYPWIGVLLFGVCAAASTAVWLVLALWKVATRSVDQDATHRGP